VHRMARPGSAAKAARRLIGETASRCASTAFHDAVSLSRGRRGREHASVMVLDMR
jgi:hypothetical protein